MEAKKVEGTLVAVHSLKTNLTRIYKNVGVTPNQIMEELGTQNIKAIAPQIWKYTGCDGQMDTEFTLEVCIPVEKKGKNTNFISFKELEAFTCLTHVHKGPWSDFANLYPILFNKLGQMGKTPTGNFREVYHHCDFEDVSKCITEIQIEA